MSNRSPTDEQTAILDFARGSSDNLMINALAGCGKTTTLEMIERAIKTKPILYLVFNKRNADEAEKRMLSTTTVRTFNSLGHRVWAATQGKNLSLNPRKVPEILREIIKGTKGRDTQSVLWDCYWEVIHGVAMAKALGYVPEGKYPTAKRLCSQATLHLALEERPDDLVSDLIDAVLTESIRQAYQGIIDYNDQIYMPALFGGTFPRFPLVLADEYQDLSPVNHAMLWKLCRERHIGVGDPWQNIYAFRGAKQGGMEEAKARWAMKEADLSVSFRCPRAVVEAARWRVPNFKWIKDGGHVETLSRLDVPSIIPGATYICRNNAPLLRCGFNLLRAGIGISMAGNDVGPKLIAILKRLGDGSLSRGAVLKSIDAWQLEREAKESTTAKDMADCMRVFAEHGSNLAQAISYAEHLFAQKGSIRLTTGHKAKGLEWDTVYHLDPWLCRDDEQDLNLRYVITTRSAGTLYEVNSGDIRW